jgi:hypothetical protein
VRDEPDEPDGFDGPPAEEAAFFGDSPLAAGEATSLSASGPGPDDAASVLDEDRLEDGDSLEGFDDSDAAPDAGSPLATPALLFERLRARALEVDRARHASLEHAECIGIEGQRMRILVATSFHTERVRSRCAELEAMATALFGRPMRLQVDLRPATQAAESADQRERARQQRQRALNSDAVNLAIEILDAKLVEIKPLGERH